MVKHLVKTDSGGGAWTDIFNNPIIGGVAVPLTSIAAGAAAGHLYKKYTRAPLSKARRYRKYLQDLQKKSPLP